MKSKLLGFTVLLVTGAFILTGCNNTTTKSYDLTNEIGRQLHCIDQFQKEKPAKDYSVSWMPEVIDGDIIFVEAIASADEEEFRLICTYMNNGEDWTTDIYSFDTIEGEYPDTYVKTELTNEDIDHIEEILPPLSFDFETWNMDDETMIESGHYDYPTDLESGYVFIPEHATMASREVKSSGIQDGMIYTDTDVTLQDDTVVSVLYIHDPETLFVRAITVENGNYTTYYRNFLYNADIE